MSKKTANQHAQDLQQQIQEAELLEDQAARHQALQTVQCSEQVHRLTAQDIARRDIACQRVQKARDMRALRDLVTVTIIETYKRERDSENWKQFKGIPLTLDDGTLVTVTNWEDYCHAFYGRSRAQVEQDIKAFEAFGEAGLALLREAGLGYRALRKARHLLESAAVDIDGEAVRLGDEEAVNDLIALLREEHAQDKQRLEAKVKDLEANLEASQRVVKDKIQKIDELDTQLHKRDLLPIEERTADLSQRLDQAIRSAGQAFNEPARVFAEIFDWEDAPRELRHACAQGIARLRITLDRLQVQYELPSLDLDVDDAWMNEGLPQE